MIQLAKKIMCRTKTRLELWEEHLKDPVAALAKANWNAWRILTGVGIWFHSLLLPAFVVAMAFSIAGVRILQKMWEGPCLGRRLALSGPMECGALAHIIASGLHRGSTGRTASSSSSLSRRNPWLSQRQRSLSPLSLRRRSRHVL